MEWLGDLGTAFFGWLYDVRVPALVGAAGIAVVFAWVARRRHWLGLARRHPTRSAAIGIPLLALAIPLTWYAASPLLTSASIDEPPPIVSRVLPSAAAATPSPIQSIGPAASRPVSGSEATPAPTTAAPAKTAPPLAAQRTGAFSGSDDFHFGRGTARLIEVAPGSFVVRLEDFAVRNGPDLYVYLSPSATGYADGAIELGRLKADTGNQNYAVPAGTFDDPAVAASVVIWCKQFSHLFATAPLAG